MNGEHLVRSFDQDLRKLRGMLTDMGGMVEREIGMATDAILRMDASQVAAVLETDKRVDALEQEIETFVIRLLALRQPMADDLRHIVAALKISTILERAGDYAANVAKRATVLAQYGSTINMAGLSNISRLVQQGMHDIVTAVGTEDLDAAIRVWRGDRAIDDVYNAIFRELLTYMMEDPRSITPCTHLMFIAKNLERIGDKATNIAEILHYAVTGQAIPEARPKGESSAYLTVPPPA